ncbi:unnamed protein product [Thelazia callipaeda]|uniref:2-(3-amino-3-carboxypropyl)histidine synthase subunit 2 n=1 Tax=Thelazia callipaeda TaxID=103827 RepID=A0A0N5DB40_THECL|nr:unnamed protein product [Thelazia callipaeda]
MDSTKLRTFFDVDSTVSWVKRNRYHRIALQFPDSLVPFAVDIATTLESESGEDVKTYILPDTTYRSCCVDWLAAEQCNADCIIHYGDSCLSKTINHLPVRFVFGYASINWQELEKAVKKCCNKFEKNCCLLFDSVYLSSEDGLCDILSKFDDLKSLFICKIIDQFNDVQHSQPSSSNDACCLGRILPPKNQCMTVLFIGEVDSPLLPLWLMTNLNCTSVFTFSPTTLQYSFEKTATSRILKKRLYLIERLRDAQTVGLVVSTLDLDGYKEALERIRKLCKLAGKKYYTLAVGKINAPKLSNFANDIEVFIILSCPYGILLDVSDFYRPVLSFFEAEVALNPKSSWSACEGWTAEFKNLLHSEYDIGSEVDITSDLSLVTGKIRSMCFRNDVDGDVNTCNAVSQYSAGNFSSFYNVLWGIQIIDNSSYDMSSVSGDYFSKRTWKGMDDSYGAENVVVQKGRSGIAMKYDSEPSV